MNAVTVYCGSSTQLDATYHESAELVGKGLGEKELTLVYGGGRIGLMGEVATSAAKHGARVVGVITHKLVGHEQANEGCDELIVVDTMQERRAMMMERGDTFLVLPGGIGTYEEMFEVLVGRQLGDHSKPIGIVNIDGYFDPLIAMLDHGIDQKFIRDAVHRLIYIHACPKNVLDHITTTKVSQPSPKDILPMHG